MEREKDGGPIIIAVGQHTKVNGSTIESKGGAPSFISMETTIKACIRMITSRGLEFMNGQMEINKKATFPMTNLKAILCFITKMVSDKKEFIKEDSF